MKRAMLFWKRALSDILEGVVLTLFLGARPPEPQFPTITISFHCQNFLNIESPCNFLMAMATFFKFN